MRLRRALLVLAAIGLIVGIGPAAWSQQIPRATCLDCHEGEGMEYAVIRTTPFIQIPQGELQEFNVVVANPWLHEITSSLITLNLTGSPAVSFETPDPLNVTEDVVLGVDETRNVTFEVQTGATAVIARMEQPEDTSERGLNDIDTQLYLGDGTVIRGPKDGIDTGNPSQIQPPSPPQPARTVEQFVIDDDRLATTGEWGFALTRAAGAPQQGPAQEEIHVEISVLYNSTRVLQQRISETIGPSESKNATFLLKGAEPGNVTIDYEVTVTDYYKHPGGVQSQDEGNATLSGQTSFDVGQTLEVGSAGPAIPATPPINWKMNARIWGEATGFIGLFMVPLSLVLGGAFGRRNVLWANKIATSARLRVLWHNALSFILLGVSLIHLVLFLYEPVYDWSIGMVWGGLGTLALIGLGITGGFQRRIARSIGYAKWRLLHIAMAVGFVASVLAHVIIDGAHFDFLRNWLGFT